MNKELVKRLLALRERIVSDFSTGDWAEIGLLTGHSGVIEGHRRLLRSLTFGDEDYSGNVFSVLCAIAEKDPPALDDFEDLLNRRYPEKSHYISAKPSPTKITFAPHVFQVPDVKSEDGLVAVMMPFNAEFREVYVSITAACKAIGGHCLRADDIWEESVIMQDVFNLIFRANVVVVDFTGKNSNVMYETGIAHTLGKLVIPISQSLSDVPFDIQHHRVLKYLPNEEGLAQLEAQLESKFGQVITIPF